ncbi:MAG: penicillin-binding protein 2 [Candidatus Omnitrophota bacterium]|jgi:cell division protein FtsI (penicillin-binding protein 3)
MRASLSARRLWFTQFCVVSLFLVIIYQLLQLTVFHHAALQELADKQHNLRIETPPFRGDILDRNGREFATNLKVPSIYAVPRLIPRAEKRPLAKKIAGILGLSEAHVLERLERDKAFVWLKRRVEFAQAEKILALRSPALGSMDEPKRFYPQGDLLSQVLGFVNIDNAGLEGIEMAHNKELQGRGGWRVTKRDALGREIRAFEVSDVPAVDGAKVHLTVDQYIQYLAERAMDSAFKQWKAKAAWAVVMDPKTGEILAMVNRPTFDLNRVDSVPPEARRNRAITDMYEPGSIFKIVAASAALNEGTAAIDTEFFCENGKYHYGPKVLHDVHAYGTLTFEDVIVKSSNIGAVKIAATLDPEVYYRYLRAFGFSARTGIDLPGEAPGFVRPPSQWSKTSAYNIPIGQEVMVTSIQVAAALSVIANGGEWVRPYVISKIEDPAGVTLRENKPAEKIRVLKPETAKAMREIMTAVVDRGTGTKAKIQGVSVGGKTGTAQKVLPGGKGYSHTNFMSSFIGFAPAEDPQLVVAVVLDDPRGSYYGGTVAAPAVKEILEGSLLYLKHVPENAKVLNLSDATAGAADGKNPQGLPTAVNSEASAAGV